MNPWDTDTKLTLKTVELGGVQSYLDFINKKPEVHLARDEQIEKQKDLLRTIDEATEYACKLSVDKDLYKFGDFISKEKLFQKCGTLSDLTEQFQRVIDYKQPLLARILEEDNQDEIRVEKEYQNSFLKLNCLTSAQNDNLDLLLQATKIHTVSLQRSQDKLESVIHSSKQIFKFLEDYEASEQEIERTKANYS